MNTEAIIISAMNKNVNDLKDNFKNVIGEKIKTEIEVIRQEVTNKIFKDKTDE